MQITRLRLSGFKSFVDPTELLIRPGLSGVVGPNGCGKSNLLEALRWVMGENRPTAMRGAGMEDVIFAGSAARPARHFAEVTLSLEAGDAPPPPLFGAEPRLEVVRRITRDAGSAYRAGGKEARAKDIQMLFADASTGAHSPALVRQGQIAELINAKPKARRRILEEAAGISGLYQRRHEAELKLQATEANLARIEEVVQALEAQLASLARQARQAARYRHLSEEIRTGEARLLWRRWQEADAARGAAAEALTAALTAVAAAEGAAQAEGRRRGAAEEALPPLREEDAIAGALLQRLIVERDQIDREAEQAAEAIAATGRRLAQYRADREREAGLDRDAAETIERLDWEGAELAKAGEGHAPRLAEAEKGEAEASGAL
ncbi:MAG: AAA family ATPase, partial [Pseudomonadota bacterium]